MTLTEQQRLTVLKALESCCCNGDPEWSYEMMYDPALVNEAISIMKRVGVE